MAKLTLILSFLISINLYSQETVEQVKDINLNGSSNPAFLTATDSILYFRCFNDSTGREICKSDGTSNGTQLLKDIEPGTANSSPSEFTPIGNNSVLFAAQTNANGRELYISDGTSAGTALLADIYSGSNSSLPEGLTFFNGSVFFAANDGLNGRELWISDGTTAGTNLLLDLEPGLADSDPFNIFSDGNLVYFSAFGPGGNEPYVTDGTSAGTRLLKDVNSGSSGSFPANFTSYMGEVFFTADDGVNGIELWKTDGTEPGTVLVANIDGGAGSSFPEDLLAYNNYLYFTATSDAVNRQLYRTNGTTIGTEALTSFSNNGGVKNEIIGYQNQIFMVVDNRNLGDELWRYAPNDDIAAIYKDISAGSTLPDIYDPREFTVFDEKLFFVGRVGSNNKLFVSNGINFLIVEEVAPTIAPITNSFAFTNSFFTEFKNDLYFAAEYNTTGRELWRIQGPEETQIPDSTVSVNPALQGEELVKLYPNPANNKLIIEVSERSAFSDYQILDLSGQILQSGKIQGKRSQLEIDHLAAGSYIFELIGEDRSKHQQLLIVHK